MTAAGADAAKVAALRIDLLLVYLRFAKTRALAQTMVARGTIRLDGRRVEKPHIGVRTGQVLTLPLGNGVLVVRIIALPSSRGPAGEAAACYTLIASDSQSGTAA